MIEVLFLIPTHGNDQTQFTTAQHMAFEKTLDRLFNGYTGPFPPVGGSWKDKGGTVYRDNSQTYMALVDGLIAAAVRIQKAVKFAKTHYQQKAITVRYLGHAEIL